MLVADLDFIDASQLLWCFAGGVGDHAERDRLVRDAVRHALSDKQREVVEAFFFEGLSQGQIARQLGITQQVVNKRLHGVLRRGRRVGGALRRLREALGPHFSS